jgi:hypothetical protein
VLVLVLVPVLVLPLCGPMPPPLPPQSGLSRKQQPTTLLVSLKQTHTQLSNSDSIIASSCHHHHPDEITERLSKFGFESWLT